MTTNKLSTNVDRYIIIHEYSDIESTFHEAIQTLPEDNGILILKFQKLHEKLIEHMCQEFRDVYDFSEAVYTTKYFVWRKTFSS